MGDESIPPTPSAGQRLNGIEHYHTLKDSLWTFNGQDLSLWSDVRDVLRMAIQGSLAHLGSLMSVPVDFYPLSILLNKGIVLGIEADLLQRHGLPFAQFRTSIRTHLFIPHLLQHLLSAERNASASITLARQYDHLSYFPHALEVLLHNVLDKEADSHTGISDKNDSLIPTVLSLLYSTLPESYYLSTIVQCIRKTEVTSWPILLSHLPPPAALFEQALQLDELKTATGCLMVLQSFDGEHKGGDHREEDIEVYVTRLMILARQGNDWELCSDLAQFLMALDPMGDALRRVIHKVGLRRVDSSTSRAAGEATGLGLTMPDLPGNVKHDSISKAATTQPRASELHSLRTNSPASTDYFSATPGR